MCDLFSFLLKSNALLQAVEQNPDTARVLPIMLATKLVPDLEARRQAHLDAYRRQAASASSSVQYDTLLVTIASLNPQSDRCPSVALISVRIGCFFMKGYQVQELRLQDRFSTQSE